MELAWYTFSPLLQYKLDQIKLQWNTHYIRRIRHGAIPGRPDELFFLPELSGGQNQGTHISDSEIDSAYSEEENLMEDAAIIMMLMKYLWNILNMLYTKRIYYILQLTGRKDRNYLCIFWKGQAHNN